MTTAQKKMYRLLDEIASVCTKHKVKYYLIGDELLWSVRKRFHMRCRADVCMTFEAYNIIAPDLESLPNRTIESIHTNRNLPGVYFRYVDTTSFMLEPEYHKVIMECGIAVNIHIIRRACPEAEALKRLEMVMDCSIEGVKRDVSDETMAEYCKLKASDDFSVRLEKMLWDCSLKKDEIHADSLLKFPAENPHIFPGGFWDKPEFITVAGKKYMSVKEKEDYLRTHYGTWDDVIPHADTFLNRVIVDADIPYSEVKDDILAELDDKDYFKKREILFDEYFVRYDKLVRERDRLDVYMRAAAERIRLWKKYYPHKKKIIGLWRNKKPDELRLVLEAMDSSIRRFEPHGFLCVFDKDIWEVYLDMLRMEGCEERVTKLEELYEAGTFGELDEEMMKRFY